MLKREQKTKPHASPQLRITHSFPEPRPDDAKRFLALVQKLAKLGGKGKRGTA